MAREVDYARLVAVETIRAMGDQVPDWTELRVRFVDPDTDDLTEQQSDMVYISLRSPSGRFGDVAAYFVRSDLPLAWSTINTVDSIQDHAVEASWGEPLPPCPGHRHPLAARVVDGVPRWVCLTEGPERYARDILPGFDPAFETPEEYLTLRTEPRGSGPVEPELEFVRTVAVGTVTGLGAGVPDWEVGEVGFYDLAARVDGRRAAAAVPRAPAPAGRAGGRRGIEVGVPHRGAHALRAGHPAGTLDVELNTTQDP